MLVFKYIPHRVGLFKYLTIVYSNHPVKKNPLLLITLHINLFIRLT